MDKQQWRTQSSLDAPDSPAAVTSVPATPPKPRNIPWTLIWVSLGVCILLGTALVIWFLRQTVLKTQANDKANSVKVQTIDTSQISGNSSAINLNSSDKVVINGQLQTNQSLILTPTNQPTDAVTGQLFIDQTTKQFKYYNGTTYVTLADQASTDALTNSLNNTANNLNAAIAAALTAANSNLTNFSSGLSSAAVTSLQNQTGAVNLVGTGGLTVSAGGSSITLALPQNLTTTSNPTFAGLTLGAALSVANGGTGQTSLAANQLLIGNGTGGIQTISAAAPGLCLQSTAGAPIFTTCSGTGAAVSDVNGQTGSITIANASGSGGLNGTITIDNASTSAKGIASFNSTNFSASSGVINTIQDISTSSNVTFSGVTSSGTITAQGSGGLVSGVGSTTTGKVTLKNATNNNSVILQSGVSTSNLTFTLPTADGSSNQCLQTNGSGVLSFANCVGGSGGAAGVSSLNSLTGGLSIANASGSGATITIDNASTSAKGIASFNSTNFSASSGVINTIQDISTSSNVTFNNIVGAGSITAQGSGGLVVGTSSSANGKIVFRNSTNTNTFTLQSGASSGNLTFTLPTADGTSGQCLKTNASGVLSFGDCLNGTGSGVASLDGLVGSLTLANSSGSGSTVTIDNASTSAKGIASFNSTNFSASSGVINTIQDINTTATPQFTGVLANSLDRATSGTLSIGTSTATALTVGHTGVTTTNNGSLTIAQNLQVTGGTTNLMAPTSGAATALSVSNNTSTGAILTLADGAQTVFTAQDGGTFLMGNANTDFGSTLGSAGAYPAAVDVEHTFSGSTSCLSGCAAIIGDALINNPASASTIAGVAGSVRNSGTNSVTLAIALDALGISKAAGAGAITSAMGLLVNPQTAGTNNYGAVISASGTQTVWVGNTADSTTSSAGIAFGLSRDTTLYRSAASTLKTNGTFTANALMSDTLDAPSSVLGLGFNTNLINIGGASTFFTNILGPVLQGSGTTGLTVQTSDTTTSKSLTLTTGGSSGTGVATGDLILKTGANYLSGSNISTGSISLNVGTPNGSGTAGNISIGTLQASPTITIGSTSSGSTVLQSASGVQVSTLGTANTATYLCRNSSNVISTCSGTATGSAFLQGGNSFGSTAILGTNDSQSLALETAGTTQFTLDTTGNITLASSASDRTLKIADQTTTNATGNALTVVAGAGNGTANGGALTLQGGAAGTSATGNGGNVTINGGAGHSTGNGGSVVLNGSAAGSHNGATLTVSGAGAAGPGGISLVGGNNNNPGGIGGGGLTLLGGSATAGNQNGGGIVIAGGAGFGTGTYGNILLGNILGLEYGNIGIGSIASPTAKIHIGSATAGLALLKVTDSTATAADVLTIADGGATTFKSQTNVANAFQVQNSSGTALFNIDTNGNGAVSIQPGASGAVNIATTNSLTVTIGKSGGIGTLIVNGLATFNNSITVVGHLLVDTASSAVVSAGGSCGTGCTASISGNDIAGIVTINTGTGVTAGTQATVTFGSTYGTKTPMVTLTPKVVPASSVFPQYYASSTATTFDIGTYTALTDSKTYTFYYHVIGQ